MNAQYFNTIKTLAVNRGLVEIANTAEQGLKLHQMLAKQTTAYSGARTAKEHIQAQALHDERKANIEQQIINTAKSLKPFAIELEKEKIYI